MRLMQQWPRAVIHDVGLTTGEVFVSQRVVQSEHRPGCGIGRVELARFQAEAAPADERQAVSNEPVFGEYAVNTNVGPPSETAEFLAIIGLALDTIVSITRDSLDARSVPIFSQP